VGFHALPLVRLPTANGKNQHHLKLPNKNEYTSLKYLQEHAEEKVLQ
jgi:hypothetical protein